MAAFLPHDLLWAAPDAIQAEGALPEWVDAAWMRRAPVVVRREAVRDGLVPVGLRGAARSQRARAYVRADAVTRQVAPESLAMRAIRASPLAAPSAISAIPAIPAIQPLPPLPPLPALSALAALAPALNALGLAWGPTGGAGFFLACGLPVLRPDSDLDLLVRAPQPLTASQAAVLDGIQDGAACRIDIQVDTGHGAFAFAEWLRGGRVLLKTGTGPLLCAQPWAEQ